jgi:hypothetical protein
MLGRSVVDLLRHVKQQVSILNNKERVELFDLTHSIFDVECLLNFGRCREEHFKYQPLQQLSVPQKSIVSKERSSQISYSLTILPWKLRYSKYNENRFLTSQRYSFSSIFDFVHHFSIYKIGPIYFFLPKRKKYTAPSKSQPPITTTA